MPRRRRQKAARMADRTTIRTGWESAVNQFEVNAPLCQRRAQRGNRLRRKTLSRERWTFLLSSRRMQTEVLNIETHTVGYRVTYCPKTGSSISRESPVATVSVIS